LDFCLNAKKPAGLGRRRASGFFDLSGLLDQAMAVRRHGGSMMVVMNEMAAALHLIKTIKETRARCQMNLSLAGSTWRGREWNRADTGANKGARCGGSGCDSLRVPGRDG
jgi:hypothetical protein